MSALFHWRDEGEPVRQGLNLYPLRSPYHLGGYLQVWRARLYLRWSKAHRRLHWSASWIARDALRSLPLSQWPRA